MIDCVHVLVQEYETDSETDSSCSCNTKKFSTDVQPTLVYASQASDVD